MSEQSIEFDKLDETSKYLLVRHTYLFEMTALVLDGANGRIYSEVYINEKEISDTLVNKYNMPNEYIGPTVSYLVASDYLDMRSPDPQEKQFVAATKKGWIAMTSGEFLQKFHDRKRDLLQESLASSTLSTNKWMKLWTGVSAFATVVTVGVTIFQQCNDRSNRQMEDEIQVAKPKLELQSDSLKKIKPL